MTEPVCAHCGEPVTGLEASLCEFMPRAEHWACGFRAIMGSVAHIEKRCGCYVPGADETDPPGMTRREAAREAVRAWERTHGQFTRN